MDVPLNEQHTVGPEKVSVTIFRKTEGDMLVAQISFERWYKTSHEADIALSAALDTLTGDGNVRGTQ